jgi:hypothetical protein
MEKMLFQDEHGLGEKTIPQGENGARRRYHGCSKMKMGTRDMKGMGPERTFFRDKIKLRKGWAKGKGHLGGNIAIHQKSPCVLREVLGHE